MAVKFVSFRTVSYAPPRLGWMWNDRWVVDFELSLYWAREQGILHVPPGDFPKDMRNMLQDWERWLGAVRTVDGVLREKVAKAGEGGEETPDPPAPLRPLFYPADSVQFAAPLQPVTIRDFYAFEEHVRNARARRGLEVVPEWYEFPAFYFSNPHAVVGHGESVRKPPKTSMLDYELEVACILGKAGTDLSVEEAESVIAGYTILNDWSARDVQRKEMKIGLGPAKAKDFATSLGPWLVTPDELAPYRDGDRYHLEMTAHVNGKLYSKGNLKDIYFTFPQMIARASEGVTLFPGEVIGSGTVGSGCILELGPEQYPWLKPGDVVTLTVTGLGSLTNTVIE